MPASHPCRAGLALVALVLLQTLIPETLSAETTQESPRNIALGKVYEFNHPPNYAPCLDADDARQLTDGKLSEGWFWTQKSTVGWGTGQPTLITIDLGKVEPIRGVSFSTAAGASDVGWPSVLMLMVSDDAKTWYVAGDLVALSAKHDSPPELGYAKHVYRTNELKMHGRYVKIGVVPTGIYSVVDEIEVFQGDESLRGSDRGPSSDDPMGNLQAVRITSSLAKQYQSDLAGVRSSIASDATPTTAKFALISQADQLAAQISKLPIKRKKNFKAVLPMSDFERDIFGLQAATWRAQQKEELRLWKTHRWDMLGPMDEPLAEAKPLLLRVDLLPGEHRADVLNITSSAQTPMELTIRIEGLPGGTNPDYVTPHEVLCIGTRHLGAISSPLPLMKRQGDSFVMTIAPGMTRQIWLDFHPVKVASGRHRGKVSVQTASGATKQVPLEMVVWPWAFPSQTTLLLSGWSYTNQDRFSGMTPSNRKALIEFLQSHHVNSPWATNRAIPTGKYDGQGKMIQPPDTTNFDQWVRDWPNAKRYMVFFGVGGYEQVYRKNFAGSDPGTELFTKKLTAWAHFWANHLRELGRKPNQLGLCLFDEPVTKAQFDLLSTWNRVIKKAEPEILAMVDPQFKVQDDTYLPMMAEMDELVPNRLLWHEHPDWYPKLYLSQRKLGRNLGFYNCAGPARSFDPYAYYLLQAWHTFQVDGVSSGYWAFSDTRDTDPWNDFSASSKGSFCPMYLLESSVMTDKRMEAIREGSQDYEYLVMLRDRIEALEALGETSPSLAKARKVLDSACDHVLADFGGTQYRWDEPADRTRVDRVRREILKSCHALSSK